MSVKLIRSIFVAGVIFVSTAGILAAATPNQVSQAKRLCMHQFSTCQFSECQDWCDVHFPGSYGVCQLNNCCNCYF